MVFLFLFVTGENSELSLDSPCRRVLRYDNKRASVRTCPCKPLLTLSIIAWIKKTPNWKLASEQDVGLSLLLFLFRFICDASQVDTAHHDGGIRCCLLWRSARRGYAHFGIRVIWWPCMPLVQSGKKKGWFAWCSSFLSEWWYFLKR